MKDGLLGLRVARQLEQPSKQADKFVDASGNVIGVVTSGTMAPTLGKGIGLGYVTVANSAVDSEIFVRIRKNDVPAKVVKLPFYKK